MFIRRNPCAKPEPMMLPTSMDLDTRPGHLVSLHLDKGTET